MHNTVTFSEHISLRLYEIRTNFQDAVRKYNSNLDKLTVFYCKMVTSKELSTNSRSLT